ncbi:uncharacterized protein LOC131239989 isoform X1 [Magnolia sinica]|uniref:uncharacterized protein LOC131239989 isoform X1 n=1 Tax=Magnolia sinica TaxID=86752 RepID=UPI002657E3E5|nr:uncharacterized protein LOC131239989 isoform X1 [Magnolia sinica]
MAKPKKQEIRETSGGAFQTNSPEGTRRYGSVGRFSAYVEVKIMDPVTGIALPPCKQGELWLRGPTITRVVEGRPVREACLPCCGIGLGWFLWQGQNSRTNTILMDVPHREVRVNVYKLFLFVMLFQSRQSTIYF